MAWCSCRREPIDDNLHEPHCSLAGKKYPPLESLNKFRRKANAAGSIAAMAPDDVKAYGEAVGEAIRKLQRSELGREATPLPAPYQSRNDYETALILTIRHGGSREAIAFAKLRAKQMSAVLNTVESAALSIFD